MEFIYLYPRDDLNKNDDLEIFEAINQLKEGGGKWLMSTLLSQISKVIKLKNGPCSPKEKINNKNIFDIFWS